MQQNKCTQRSQSHKQRGLKTLLIPLCNQSSTIMSKSTTITTQWRSMPRLETLRALFSTHASTYLQQVCSYWLICLVHCLGLMTVNQSSSSTGAGSGAGSEHPRPHATVGGHVVGCVQCMGGVHGGAGWGDTIDTQWAVDDRLEVYRGNAASQQGGLQEGAAYGGTKQQ